MKRSTRVICTVATAIAASSLSLVPSDARREREPPPVVIVEGTEVCLDAPRFACQSGRCVPLPPTRSCGTARDFGSGLGVLLREPDTCQVTQGRCRVTPGRMRFFSAEELKRGR